MKLLVVGCGSIGRRHLANLLTLKAGVVAACDPDPAARGAAAALGVETFPELDRALAWRPDAVLACTPTHRHLDIALAAIDAGAHCFVEKPIAASLDGTEILVARARAYRRIVLVGCNMRFHPGVAHLKASISAMTGRPWLFRAHFAHYLPNWRPDRDYRTTYSARAGEGGGIILDAVHEIDYLQWLGGRIVEVEARGGRVGDLSIDSEDHAFLRLAFESGAVAEVRLDYLRPVKSRGCEVMGSGLLLEWTSDGKAPERVRVRHFDAGSAEWKELYRSEAYDGNAMYLDEMRHFLDCVAGRAEPALDAEAAGRVLRLALEARDQVRRASRS